MRTAPGVTFRWLRVGGRARYVGRDGLAVYREGGGVVVAVPSYKPARAPKNVVVRLDNGHVVIAPAGCFRAVPA